MGLYCIVGLGNPGSQYSQTRHNAGFLVVEQLLKEYGATMKEGFQSLYCKVNYEGRSVLLVKPQTFMNLSGQAVRAVTDYYKVDLSKVLIVYDDLDLPVGALRFRTSGSAGGHRGLTSIIEHLHTTGLSRLRLGIGRPAEGIPVPNYVLTPFAGGERESFNEIVRKAAASSLAFIRQGPEYTMNHFNINP
jgi:PTH1 family peptidyl-tRNA hydrolase